MQGGVGGREGNVDRDIAAGGCHRVTTGSSGFLGVVADHPPSCVGLRSVEREIVEPRKSLIEQRSERSDGQLVIGVARLVDVQQSVDLPVIGFVVLDERSDGEFDCFGLIMFDSPKEGVIGVGPGSNVGPGVDQPVEDRDKFGGAAEWGAVLGRAGRHVGPCPLEQIGDPCSAHVTCRCGPHFSEGELAHTNPRMNEPGLMEKERHQTEPGGVAESEATPWPVEGDGGAAAPGASAVFNDVVAQFPIEVGGEKLGTKTRRERVIGWIALKGPHPDLSVSVERRAAHDVAAVGNGVRIRGVAGGEIIDQAVEESNAPVAAGEDQEPRIESAVFLLGHLCLRNVEEFVVGCAFDERSTDLPAIRDHPVGVVVLGQCLGEGDEREGVSLCVDAIHGVPLASLVHLESGSGETPSRRCRPTQE